MVITSPDKDRKQLEFIVTDGNTNFWCLVVLIKLNVQLPCDSAMPLLARYYPQKCENIKGPHKDMNPSVHRFFIHNGQKLDTT